MDRLLFSDESGEYALHLRDQKGVGEVKKIALPPTFYQSPTWSPDSKKIALYDKKLQLWYLEIEKGTPVKVDSNPIGLNNSVLQPGLVARQPLDRLHQTTAQSAARRLRLFARNRQERIRSPMG